MCRSRGSDSRSTDIGGSGSEETFNRMQPCALKGMRDRASVTVGAELLAAGVAPLSDAAVSASPLPFATAKPAAARTATPPSTMAALGPPVKLQRRFQMLCKHGSAMKRSVPSFRPGDPRNDRSRGHMAACARWCMTAWHWAGDSPGDAASADGNGIAEAAGLGACGAGGGDGGFNDSSADLAASTTLGGVGIGEGAGRGGGGGGFTASSADFAASTT